MHPLLFSSLLELSPSLGVVICGCGMRLRHAAATCAGAKRCGAPGYRTRTHAEDAESPTLTPVLQNRVRRVGALESAFQSTLKFSINEEMAPCPPPALPAPACSASSASRLKNSSSSGSDCQPPSPPPPALSNASCSLASSSCQCARVHHNTQRTPGARERTPHTRADLQGAALSIQG